MSLVFEPPKSLALEAGAATSPGTYVYNNVCVVFAVGKDGAVYSSQNHGAFKKLGGQVSPRTSPYPDPGDEGTHFNGGKGIQYVYENGSIYNAYPVTTGILPGCTPAVIKFKGTWYFFYVTAEGLVMTWGAAGNYSRKPTPVELAMPIHPNTGPAALAFQDKIYVFYNAGNDGLWYMVYGTEGTVLEKPQWLRKDVAGQAPEFVTSPTLAVVKGGKALMVMWSGIGLNGTWYSLLENGKWTPQASISEIMPGKQELLPESNACAVELNGKLNFFWNGPDSVPRVSIGTFK